jgi:hypothetical protein
MDVCTVEPRKVKVEGTDAFTLKYPSIWVILDKLR